MKEARADVSAPTAEQVEQWWVDMIEGRRTRADVSALAGSWVAGSSTTPLPGVVSLGLTYLHGADLRASPAQQGSDLEASLLRHEGEGAYYRSMKNLQADLDYWRGEVALFRRDPEVWRSRRLAKARELVQVEQRAREGARGQEGPSDVAGG